jgi:hypothetical protein
MALLDNDDDDDDDDDVNRNEGGQPSCGEEVGG